MAGIALPDKVGAGSLTDAATTNAQQKSNLGKIRDYLAYLFGTSGERPDALAALKVLDPTATYNLKLTFAVNANTLITTLKDRAGNDLGADNQGFVSQRSITAGDHGFLLRPIIGNVALTLSEGSTLGAVNGVAHSKHWYLVDNGGAEELAVSGSFHGFAFIGTTVAEGGAGGADSLTTIYSANARVDKPIRWIGCTRDTQAAAGTYLTLPAFAQPGPMLPFLDLQEDAAPDVGADWLTTFDVSTGTFRKVKPQNLIAAQYVPVRQTVLRSAIDTSGRPAFLAAGAGLNFNIEANPVNLQIAFAGGFNATGAVDLLTTISADAANQGALAANNTSFVHASYLSATTVTWGQCLAGPQYGYAFDRSKTALLNFEGADASTNINDDFGNTWITNGNAQLDTAWSKFGAASLLLDGNGDYIKSTDLQFPSEGWTIEGHIRLAALPANGTAQYIASFVNAAGFGMQFYLHNNAGTYELRTSLSSNGTSANIANASASAVALPAINTPYHVVICYDALSGHYRTYWEGAAEHAIASTEKICAITKAMFGVIAAENGSYFNGWMDGLRFMPFCKYPNGTGFAVPGAQTVASDPIHFFSIPEMTMYEVTGAAPGAGQNPAMTARNRVFVGEADTNGANVTAVRNYAARGEWMSDVFALPADATATSKADNLGLPGQVVELEAVGICLTGEFGYAPGDVVAINPYQNSGATDIRTMTQWRRIGRNTFEWTTGSNGVGVIIANTGAMGTLNAGKWAIRLYAKRRF